ncbi:MAG: hypothetical protein WCJ37_13645 [Syntrophus sp. (in: bacteria)]
MTLTRKFRETVMTRVKSDPVLRGELIVETMKRKTNFGKYLDEQLKDQGFANRFKKAGEAWNVAMELAAR